MTLDTLYDTLEKALDASDIRLDKTRIEDAYLLAKQKHEGQMRESGEPYITHPVHVAIILIQMECDGDTVIAALLHDVLEDTDTSKADLRKRFGSDVAELVDGVTKLSRISFSTKEEQQVENIRKMLLAMAKDIRVILIKLADRLHNMRTIGCLPDAKRRKKAHETMEIYAPLAHRLGMQKIKMELEDISLRCLDPVGYAEIEKSLEDIRARGDSMLAHIKERIGARMKEQNISYVMESRVKQVYSIYRKMFTQHRDLDDIYDLYAIRIIVNTINECYNTFGIIHDIYKPIPGRFKDYISTPKPNMYQSLHTTVIGKEGIPFEVQIRTEEMHRIAEYGIAAHWKYKRGIFGKDDLDGKLEWVRSLLESQKDVHDAEDFMSSLKVDLISDEVFVFTPKGDVINLPAGANVIDFAYAIHSAVGSKMAGAKVNGRIVELTYALKNGEICEILTSPSSKGPSRDWLTMATTSSAKTKIRQWFKKERREENLQQGKEDLEREIRRCGIALDDRLYKEIFPVLLKKFGAPTADELYVSIGYGGILLSKVMSKIKEEYQRLKRQSQELTFKESEPRRHSASGIVVEGIDNCLVKFAQCCNPLPGDDIIGFITRGFGVSVHKRDCANIQSMSATDEQKQRLINVHWDLDTSEWFSPTLNIVAHNRIGLMSDISTLLAGMRVMIHRMNARETKDRFAIISVTIDVKNLEHLNTVSARIKKVQGVMEVSRGVG